MKILVTSTFAEEYGNDVLAATPAGSELICFDPIPDSTPPDVTHAEVAFLSLDLMGGLDAEGAHPRLRVFSKVVEAIPNLRWLHTQASGADRPVLQNALRRGIIVTTSSGATAETVAHTAIAGMLAMARGVPDWIVAQAEKTWDARPENQWPRDIHGSQALVVGTGPIGQNIAHILNAMGVAVTGVRRSSEPLPNFDRMLRYDQIQDSLHETDWLFLACPLTENTRGLVNEAFLTRLAPHAHIVNVARGEVVVDKAVQAALHTGRLGGYYSDVFSHEPLDPDSAWWDTPRTLISPHLAAKSAGYAARAAKAFLDNLKRYARGEPLRNVVK